jgi:hypothetical protein
VRGACARRAPHPAEGHATFADNPSGAAARVRPDADTVLHESRETPFLQGFPRTHAVGTAPAMPCLRLSPPQPTTQETTMTIRLLRTTHGQRTLEGLKVFSICAAGVATGLMLGLTRLIAG